MKENDCVYSEIKADALSTQGWVELILKKDVLAYLPLISYLLRLSHFPDCKIHFRNFSLRKCGNKITKT